MEVLQKQRDTRKHLVLSVFGVKLMVIWEGGERGERERERTKRNSMRKDVTLHTSGRGKAHN